MDHPDLRQYLGLFRKWLWLLALCTLLAGVSAYIISVNMPPVYESTTTLVLEQGGTQYLMSRALYTSPWEAATYAELMPQLLPDTAARLGLDKIDKRNVTIQMVRDTRVLNLKVQDNDPKRAAKIANTIPLVFAEYTESLLLDRFAESKTTLQTELKRLEEDINITQSRIANLGSANNPAEEAELKRLEIALSQSRYNYGQLLASYEQVHLSEMQAKGNLVIFRQAIVPQTPIGPRILFNTILAAIAGLMLGIGIAYLIEYLDDTLKNPEAVARSLNLATLGSIARLHLQRRKEPPQLLVSLAEPRSPISEAFRALRTNLQFSSVDHPIGRLLVTSSVPENGKSFIAANLAIVFAQAGQSVVLVDCDLRRPIQHKLFDLQNNTGLTNSLISEANANPEEWLQRTGVENLRLLSPGPLPPNPAEMVGSLRMAKLIEQLAKKFDVVIFDSPPVLSVTDAAILSRQADGVLLVIEAGGTHEKEARRAVEELAQVGAPVLGVALNKIPVGEHGGYGYEYYRHYYSRPEEEGSEVKEGKSKGGFLGPLREALQRKPRNRQYKTGSIK